MKGRAAARGYGYVACSRFKSRSGCYLYGKMRRSDFLPVGGIPEEEVLERGYFSVSSQDSDGVEADQAAGAAAEYVDEISDFGDVAVSADFE